MQTPSGHHEKDITYGVISEKMEDDDNNDRSIEVIELGVQDSLNKRAKNDDYKNVKYTSGENNKRPTYETRL